MCGLFDLCLWQLSMEHLIGPTAGPSRPLVQDDLRDTRSCIWMSSVGVRVGTVSTVISHGHNTDVQQPLGSLKQPLNSCSLDCYSMMPCRYEGFQYSGNFVAEVMMHQRFLLDSTFICRVIRCRNEHVSSKA